MSWLHKIQYTPDEINSIFNSYDRTKLLYPASGRLKLKNADNYDEIIAIWTDYFNKKFSMTTPLDPDVIKALISSESDFRLDPPGNKIAFGIAQITKETLKSPRSQWGSQRFYF